MLKSMTGYGKSSCQADDLSIELEVKSVNSRYLDINIKMPNSLNFLEDSIRSGYLFDLINTYKENEKVIERNRTLRLNKDLQNVSNIKDVIIEVQK